MVGKVADPRAWRAAAALGRVGGARYPGRVDCEVRFHPSQQRVRVPRGASLLDAARGAGLPVARACGGTGLCSRCGVRVLSGPVSVESADEAHAKRANRVDPELRLACLARLQGDVVVTAAYW